MEAGQLPPALIPVTHFLAEGTGVVRAAGGWCEWKQGILSLPVDVTVVPLQGQDFPQTSLWHLVISTVFYPATIKFFPDAEYGPRTTYPHQDAVTPKKGAYPWSGGHPCLGEPSDAWGRYGDGREPTGLSERLLWNAERFAGWCQRAAEGRLHNPGSHFELPPLPSGDAATVIGFYETEDSFAEWRALPQTSGVARLIEVSSPRRGMAVQTWRDTDNKVVLTPPWGTMIRTAETNVIPCFWARISSLPVVGAWQLPRTYRELGNILLDQGLNLEDIFELLGKGIRKANALVPPMMMLGFPIPERFGDAAVRIHWLAIQNIPLAKKKSSRTGFRANDENRQRFDRELARSTCPLDWAKCENWAPDQIRSRLRKNITRPPRMLLLGAGALGSQVAETLARTGISEISIQDVDNLAAGNICRHSLDFSSIGRNKADAVSERLNSLQPDIRAKPLSFSFPEVGAEGLSAPEEYDVVLDCTAENSVLRALAAIAWKSDKLFISMSLTWGANALAVWSSRGTAFPSLTAIERLDALAAQRRLPGERKEVMEGIGCWHPIFPADAADVQVWAGFASRFVLDMIAGGAERCGIYYFQEDGTIGYQAG